MYFLDAKRDIADDLLNRSSFWYKMISDPGLSEADVLGIENELTAINERIVKGSECSPTFKAISQVSTTRSVARKMA